MQTTFISQGLDPKLKTVGDWLGTTVGDTRFSRFTAFVAFASAAGVKFLLEKLNAAPHIRERTICVGVDQKSTSEEALNAFLHPPCLRVLVFHVTGRAIYHPKVYLRREIPLRGLSLALPI